MDKQIAVQWVAALRSGDYKQGRRQLRNGANEFCCLGVLCNLHAQAHPTIAAAQKELSLYMGFHGELAPAVLKWSGISTPYGRFDTANKLTIPDDIRDIVYNGSLSAANDIGIEFRDIATFIELNYKYL